ncbi:MAG TPA: LPS export ABC transporter ATP-binding protein [Candidatus Polarisedimenticolia bacterium]|nr:LPS export ABC transporter ATP-binding protein [Candidatus Polarisedimenticolia bacterium]
MAQTLTTEDLRKSYRGRWVVRDVSIAINGGEVVGLLGPNGAGKTTTFSCVLGLVAPDGGRVLLNGEDITRLPMYQRARRGIGYLPQEPSVFRKMTVQQNLLAILETLGLESDQVAERARALLDEFGIARLAGQKASTLSGGERRRLEIARALTTNPSFILLDEPFAGIDPKARFDLQQVVAHLKERGLGILVTDHNVRETLQITDRAYIIHDGIIFQTGTPEALATDPRVRDVYLGEQFTLS